MSTTSREVLVRSRWSRGREFVGRRLALLAIRLLVSVNLLYAAIFLKFAGAPGSVALFEKMSQAAQLGAGLIVVWITPVLLSHIFVLGYGWFFVDALVVMALAVICLLLTRRLSPRGEHDRRTSMWV